MKRTIKIFILIIVLAAAATAFFWLDGKFRLRLATEKARLAQDVEQKAVLEDLKAEPAPPEQAPSSNTAAQAPQAAASIPTKYLLAMPFYSQAPNGNWDSIHENTCEEASVLNAGLYLTGKKLSSADFDREMMNLIEIEKKLSINYTDSTITETKQFSDAYFAGKVSSKIIDNPAIEDIEREVAAGHPVIVPLAGREIGNPNYTPPGPLYHMLVVKGYDEKFFITNDVGTRKGDSYVFRKEIIMDKMHDWNAADIHLGAKRILVLYK